MTAAPVPRDEEQRLAVLDALDILDTAPEKATDDLAELAADLAGTPIALVSLVDRTRQWFKACVGLEGRETPREHSFCAWCVFDQEPLVVTDARRDPRFATNPLVADAPHVRFYAGFPLVTRDGYCLGSLCVIDREPRELEDATRRRLARLADVAVEILEARSTANALDSALEQVDALSALLPVCERCGEACANEDQLGAASWRSQDGAGATRQRLCAACRDAQSGSEQ